MEYKWRDESINLSDLGIVEPRFRLDFGAFTIILVKFTSSPSWDVYAAMGYDKHDHVPMKLLTTFPTHTCEKWAKHDAVINLLAFLDSEHDKIRKAKVEY